MRHSENIVIDKIHTAWKNVGVRVCALNLALCGVHMNNKVCAVCTHIIMMCVVCAVLAEHRKFLLVCTQCGYMLLCDNLDSGACRVLVCSGDVLKYGMV
jgi:hypothetical protein